MNRETLKKIDRFLTFGDIKPKVDETDCYYITDKAMQKVIDGFSKELLEMHRIITMNQLIEVRKGAGQVEPEVKVKLADILQILDDEEYTVSVHSNDTIDDKISESIANTAIIDFKKQLKQELLSKFSA